MTGRKGRQYRRYIKGKFCSETTTEMVGAGHIAGQAQPKKHMHASQKGIRGILKGQAKRRHEGGRDERGHARGTGKRSQARCTGKKGQAKRDRKEVTCEGGQARGGWKESSTGI